MPYLDACRTHREFQVKWVNQTRYEVIEWFMSAGARTLVGCVFVGKSERDANQYIGQRVGGLSLVNGQVVCSKLAGKYEKAMQQIFEGVCK